MKELEAHLREHPDDGEAWLVYADWLLEQGDVRGELVHGQPIEPQAAWRGAIPDDVAIEWRYGFVVGITLSWTDPAFTPDVTALLADPAARLLTTLRLRTDELDPLLIDRLDLRQLRVLDLAYCNLGRAGAEALAARPHRLVELDLRYDDLGDDGLAALLRNLDGVESLHLQQNQIGPRGARALAASALRLRELDLRYNTIGAEGAAALAASPVVARLDRLWLHNADVGRDGARALAESPHLPEPLRRSWRAA